MPRRGAAPWIQNAVSGGIRKRLACVWKGKGERGRGPPPVAEVHEEVFEGQARASAAPRHFARRHQRVVRACGRAAGQTAACACAGAGGILTPVLHGRLRIARHDREPRGKPVLKIHRELNLPARRVRQAPCAPCAPRSWRGDKKTGSAHGEDAALRTDDCARDTAAASRRLSETSPRARSAANAFRSRTCGSKSSSSSPPGAAACTALAISCRGGARVLSAPGPRGNGCCRRATRSAAPHA